MKNDQDGRGRRGKARSQGGGGGFQGPKSFVAGSLAGRLSGVVAWVKMVMLLVMVAATHSGGCFLYDRGVIGPARLLSKIDVDEPALRAQLTAFRRARAVLDEMIKSGRYPRDWRGLQSELRRRGVVVVGNDQVGVVGHGRSLPRGQQEIIDFYEKCLKWRRQHPRAFRHPPASQYYAAPAEYIRRWVEAERDRLDEVIEDMEAEMRAHGVVVP